MDTNLKTLLQNKSNNWGNTIQIHSGPSHYFLKHFAMSGTKWPETFHKRRFKTFYIESGKGVMIVESQVKNQKDKYEIESGSIIKIFPCDKYQLEVYQDMEIFEVGTPSYINDTYQKNEKGEFLCLS